MPFYITAPLGYAMADSRGAVRRTRGVRLIAFSFVPSVPLELDVFLKPSVTFSSKDGNACVLEGFG